MVEVKGRDSFSVWFTTPKLDGSFDRSSLMLGNGVPFESALERARLLSEYLKERKGYSPGPTRVFIVPSNAETIDLDQYFNDNK